MAFFLLVLQAKILIIFPGCEMLTIIEPMATALLGIGLLLLAGLFRNKKLV